MSARKRLIAGAAFFMGAALIAGAIWIYADMQRQLDDATPEPSPVTMTKPYPNGFPMVDWEFWESINPDIIGWVTIPETSIDLPIVQGPAEDPDYYLSHDIYKNPNANGCPYLDAECAEMGLLSRNCVIFAHHSSNGAMFSDLAKYSDLEFANEHPRILLQTPEWRATLMPRMVDVVNASKEPKQVIFEDDAEFDSWWQEKRSDVTLDIDAAETPARAYSFVTCSYNTWKNERTIVYASKRGWTVWPEANPSGGQRSCRMKRGSHAAMSTGFVSVQDLEDVFMRIWKDLLLRVWLALSAMPSKSASHISSSSTIRSSM